MIVTTLTAMICETSRLRGKPAHRRALLKGKMVHIHDVPNDPEYTWKRAQELGNFQRL
jgi:hypothetical protein